jgi:hypothetical protein
MSKNHHEEKESHEASHSNHAKESSHTHKAEHHAHAKSHDAKDSKTKSKIGLVEYAIGFAVIVLIVLIVLAIPYLLGLSKTTDASTYATIALGENEYMLTNGEIDAYLNILASVDQRDFLAENLILLHTFNLKADELGIPQITEEMAQILAQHTLELDAGLSDPNIQPILAERGITGAEFKERSLEYARLSIRANEVLKMEVIPQSLFAEENLRDFYTKNQDLFQNPQMVDASHILICHVESFSCQSELSKSESLALILAVKSNIESGTTTFEEAAAQYGSDGTKDFGGNLGKFPRGAMVADFEQVAFSLPVGVISEPVETDFGYHLVKVNEKFPAQIEPFSVDVVEPVYFEKQLVPLQEIYIINLQNEAVVKYASED